MQNLLLFFFRNRFFLFFLLLEVVAFTLVVRKNSYQSASFFSSSNQIAGSISDYRAGALDYLSLNEQNQKLAEENARLRQRLTHLDEIIAAIDTSNSWAGDSVFTYIPARVINNTFLHNNNYFTINKGKKDGIRKGMGVLSADGVAGIVRVASENYATVTSQLNTALNVSVKFRKNGVLGTMNWTGNNPTLSNMLYVPKHQPVFEGDTIVTTGYSAAFPEDFPVGIVRRVGARPEAAFHDISVKLSTDFTNLKDVYVFQNSMRAEKDSLERGINLQVDE